MIGARLKRLGVPTVIVEKNERAGDSWRNRYKSLCLHDPVWSNHLPYIPFPDHWPVFIPKDQMGDWVRTPTQLEPVQARTPDFIAAHAQLEMYTKVMELQFWCSTTVLNADYDDEAEAWTVLLDREGTEMTLRPTHLIFATGMSGKPSMPSFEGQESFDGEIMHSSEFRTAEE